MDYQDLWTTDFYHQQGIRPPGGWIKYNVMSALAKIQQRSVLNACDGLLAVTAAYFDILSKAYPRIDHIPTLSMPFPACQSDRERIVSAPVKQPFFAKGQATINWVYVGVCGPLMKTAVTAILHAVAQLRQRIPTEVSRLRLYFLGTSYAPSGTGIPTVKPIADELGVGDLVTEVTDRLPYSMALQCLEDADALVVPGQTIRVIQLQKFIRICSQANLFWLCSEKKVRFVR